MATARGFSARQGQFDGLCGLYSIVNSVVAMSEGKISPHDLMEAMICHLEKRRALADTFNNGANLQRLMGLLGVARTICRKAGLSLTWEKPLQSRCRDTGKTRGIADIWGQLAAHQTVAGESAIILGLGGRFVHWSCVRKVGDRSLAMTDSGNENHQPLARIDRRFCTTGEATRDRPHILEEAMLLSLSPA